ncbi:inactive tyrosine-protein kinase PEAK1-like isoform X2 [Actinia tenebrosa]|uniref:Inactive tyrosine-protein kinase PEAK1-like isoform X2 n=1 Tax=Actinia tenebrosa TaxID=6105 RepID=A0A6P8HGQ5_ACTTE|nr:inactive tyrosine-protein kinase PEAK1-like isoform X2 [Actinia tenebrosa]
MSGCSNYAENLWKKGKCSNCFRSKEQHFTGTKDVPHANGDSCLIKSNHEASKSPNIKTNGLPNSKRQTSSEVSVDGEEFIKRGTVKRAGIVYRAPGSEFSKRLSSYQATLRINDSSSSETQNTALSADNRGTTDSLDKPKPVYISTRERTASKASHDSEDDKNVRCSVWSSESSITEPKTHLHDSKNNVNNNANENFRCAASADLPKEKEISRNNKVEADDIKQDQVNKRDVSVKESRQYENSSISQRKNTREEKNLNMDSKSIESNGKDGEYMQMKNNVCRGMEDDNKTDVDATDKIQSTYTCESDDKTKRIINKSDSLTSANKQNGVISPNNIIKDVSDRPSNGPIEPRHINHTSSSCETQETLNLEPHYENRRSIDSDGKDSLSSNSPVLERPFISSVLSTADRPESIAFKVQSDLGELRESSIFEDIVVEPSETSNNSDSSKASSSMPSSPVTDTKTSTESQRNKSTNGNGEPFDSHPRTGKQQGTIERRHSNPDVTKLVEGPCYANADVKPKTKPYKVVDISAGIPVHCNEDEHADTPPLPPKEKELNRQKEDSIPDHYYCEPPDDIVPDYKKLTPQNKDPPPIEIKKDPEKGVPPLPKAGPVPRPRSQLPSHSATLPRPVPRAVKVEVDIKDVTRGSRPVSQVVTRTHKKEAPKPPSTSSIPSRKHTSDLTPPTSPTGKHSPGSPECSQYQGSGNTVDSKDPTIKPKRMAPPPPKANSTGRVSSQKETQIESPRDFPTPSPAGQYKQPESSQSSKAQSKSGSGIKRALSSWKRLSGRRKNKRKLEISSPILVKEENESNSAQKEEMEKKVSEARSTSPVCTNIKDRQRDSTILSQKPPEEAQPVVGTEVKEANSSPQLPARKSGRSYQNFPFSKTDIKKPVKPSRPARAVIPVVQVKPEVNQKPMSQNIQHEAPAYLEPCTGQLTLKVEAALANLNDAKILAETLTRVEQEKLGPLPEVPRSRHVHFRFNETADKTGKPAPKQSPKRPVTAVAPTVVNRQADMKSRQPKYPSRPPNTKPFASDEKKRSKSLSEQKTAETGTGNSRSRSMSTQDNPVKKRYDKILELHRQTLEDMINSSKAVLLPGDNISLSNTKWNDYVVCGSPMDIDVPGAVCLPVVCPKVDEELTLLAKVKFPKSVTEDMSQRTAYMQDMAVTVSLPSHPNVSRTITHFTDYLQGEVFGVKNASDFETLVTITDQVPVESVLEFVERTKEEHLELPDEYERKVCILLLQLFSALVHLHKEGIVHRDIRLNSLLLLDHGHLVLSNFSHVLQNSGGDNSSSRFEYHIDSVGHIGRDPCRIPPEIHKAYNCGKLMNYEKCDVFAVGCLIYELLHENNPFAADSSLLTRDYTIHDLPMLTEASRFTRGLAALASGLLQRDPQMRMLPDEALKLLQAYLWGPEDLDESCLESSASDWLETERAHAVIMIARSQSHGSVVGGDEFVENFLKYEYLVTLTEEVVLEGYNALALQNSSNLAATI